VSYVGDRDRSGSRDRSGKGVGYYDRTRKGPAIGGMVRPSKRRDASAGTEAWRGTVQGADLRTDCALVVWSHQPTILHRIPYSWLVEVTS